ncbi:MAG: cysteine desulfurase [Spirochaetaceae bacterium]|nr:MAG: cysteine desulfurase [Spirochaetaceae bacterium]
MSSIYLDWAATAPPDPEIQEQMQKIARTIYANPAAIHRLGREGEKFLSHCRQRMADLLGCGSEELVFTSGATESNNMVLFSLLHKKRDRRVLISGIEHSSVYQPAQTLKQLGFEVVLVPADRSGRIDPNRIFSALDESTVLVAVMLVNNETGRIQPVREISEAVQDFQKRSGKKVLLHTDAVQAFGKIPFQPSQLGVDSAALSAHKLAGPRGVGALFVRSGRIQRFLYSGGGQEFDLRPGTENLPGIAGFVLAAEKAIGGLEENHRRAVAAMSSLLEELAGMPEVVLVPGGGASDRAVDFSPYILNLSIPPLPGEVLVRVLEEEGFIVSTGAACSSKKKDRFRVLENMGIPGQIASSALRVSTGPKVEPAELEAFAAALKRRVPELMKNITD